MIANQEKPLQILSASAGSGKTYNLVLTYLRLILNENEHTDVFSAIIAMTFTNKAATEMKSRIIEALNLLSDKDVQNAKAQKFLAEISESLAIPKEKIQFRSALVLKQVLHQYENFNVLTIDKFNLRLIRSFARDLNINNDFQTTTNEKEVLSQLVDQIYSEINEENQKNLTNIALKLSKDRFEEEAKWDFKNDLNEFVSVLLKEQNLELIEVILTEDFSFQRYQDLRNDFIQLKKQFQEKANELHRIFFSYDFKNFPSGSNSENAFKKLSDFFANKLPEHENYFSNTIYKAFFEDPKGKSFPDEIKQKGIEFAEFFKINSIQLERLRRFLDQYFFVAILKIIAKELNSFKKSENVVLISEFNKLISELLKDEFAPYIYERIGNRYKHFLLDEFQDTSRLQWTNLIPLIHESLSKEHANLIVGDPKQSIYRFKNGLAEQFVALPEIYNPENDPKLNQSSQFFKAMGGQRPLKDNYRSRKEIVEFNNSFFEQFRTCFPEIIEQFYQDIHQNPKGESGAYIYFESELNDKNQTYTEDEESEDEILPDTFPFLYDWIEECISLGYDYGDICILDHTKSTCNAYANYLNSKGLTVVSSDSLLMGADLNVKLLVQFIKWRNKPASEIEARKFSEMYLDLKNKNAIQELKKYWKEVSVEDRKYMVFDSKAFLIHEFDSEENFFFHFENLYQLTQKAFVLFGLDEFQSPYLHQFSDYVFLFDQKFGPELNLFLEYYEKEGKLTPVIIPENKDAIKIMTGHKAKGLEFPVVMVPSLSWNILNNKAKFLIKDKDFVYYTSLSAKSKVEAIRIKHTSEFNQAILDKVNLNYVIFTRPKDRLYIRNKSFGTKDKDYQKIVHQVIQNLSGVFESKVKYEFGNKSYLKSTSVEISEEAEKFYPILENENLWFPEISLQNQEVLTTDAISEERRFGNQLHEILSLSEESKSPENIVNELILKGTVEIDFKEKLIEQATRILDFEEYKVLFQNSKEVLKEQSIIFSENESKRPDIVIVKENETIVVDYKTGMEDKKYVKQIQLYSNTLKKMGFENVRGILFYTSDLKLVEC